MVAPALPPSVDLHSIIGSDVPLTTQNWLNFLEKGVHGVRVSPGVDATAKVYGQNILRRTICSGLNSKNTDQNALTRDILLHLYDCTRGRNLKLMRFRGRQSIKLPFVKESSSFSFPVPAAIINRDGLTPLCVLARKNAAFSDEGYQFFGGLLRLAIDRTSLIDRDVEICDISAPDGKVRCPRVFMLSSISLLSEAEINERLAILVEAYDALCQMELPQKSRPSKRPDPNQMGLI